MPWYLWVVVAVIILSSVSVILNIGKPRKPLTPVDAVIIVGMNVLFVYALSRGCVA